MKIGFTDKGFKLFPRTPHERMLSQTHNFAYKQVYERMYNLKSRAIFDTVDSYYGTFHI